jgi:hypothetical protein
VIAPVPLVERGQPHAHLAVLRGAQAGVKIQGAAPVITGQAGVAGDVVGGSEAVVRGTLGPPVRRSSPLPTRAAVTAAHPRER